MFDYTILAVVDAAAQGSLIWAMPACRPTHGYQCGFVAFECDIDLADTGTNRIYTDKERFRYLCVRHPTEEAVEDLETTYVERGCVPGMYVMQTAQY